MEATDLSCSTHCHFNGHFPRKPGLAGCPLDSQSVVILILSILTGQTKSLPSAMSHMVLQAVPRLLLSTYINKRSCTPVNGTLSHSYGASLAIWDHAVLPATRHPL